MISRLILPCRLTGLLTCLLNGLLMSLLFVGDAQAWKPYKPPPEGWRGELAVGVQATRGNTHTTSVSGDNEFSYRGERWESEFEINFLRASASVAVDSTDSDGEPVLDAQGEPERETVNTRTNDRRVVSLQPLYFFTRRMYVFTRLDHEANRPAGLHYANRSIAGLGHRLINDKHNRFDAEIGVGYKRRKKSGEAMTRETIGYVGLAYARELDERARLKATLESDFASEESFTKLELSLSVKVTERLSLKIAHNTRTNQAERDPRNPLASKLDSQFTLLLGVEVF